MFNFSHFLISNRYRFAVINIELLAKEIKIHFHKHKFPYIIYFSTQKSAPQTNRSIAKASRRGSSIVSISLMKVNLAIVQSQPRAHSLADVAPHGVCSKANETAGKAD